MISIDNKGRIVSGRGSSEKGVSDKRCHHLHVASPIAISSSAGGGTVLLPLAWSRSAVLRPSEIAPKNEGVLREEEAIAGRHAPELRLHLYLRLAEGIESRLRNVERLSSWLQESTGALSNLLQHAAALPSAVRPVVCEGTRGTAL